MATRRPRRNTYKIMEQYMTYALIADAALFILYLLFAGFGVLWGKILTALLIVAVSGLCLAWLYLTKELTRRRSQWMTLAAGALVVVTLISVICNYPSPNKLKDSPLTPVDNPVSSSSSETTETTETPSTGAEAEGQVSFSDCFVT